MADISNLKINGLSNVERLYLEDSLKYKIEIQKIKGFNSFISKRAIMRIGEIASDAEYRTIPKIC